MSVMIPLLLTMIMMTMIITTRTLKQHLSQCRKIAAKINARYNSYKICMSYHFKILLECYFNILLNGQFLVDKLIAITRQFVWVWRQVGRDNVAQIWSAIQSTALSSGHDLYRPLWNMRHFLKLSNKPSHQFYIWPDNKWATSERREGEERKRRERRERGGTG